MHKHTVFTVPNPPSQLQVHRSTLQDTPGPSPDALPGPADDQTPDGFICLDKPFDLSSARAVARVKAIARRQWPNRKVKVGHAGTLDPAATGVLVLLLGKATKQCEKLMGRPKQYLTTVRLGATTATDDAEAEPVERDVPHPPGAAEVAAALRPFVGTIQQVPPRYSAVKVSGKRAYQVARSGEDVQLTAKTVRCDRLEIRRYAWPVLELEMDTGRGFYVRSLARDLGDALGVGGHLLALRRTRVGTFTLANSVSLDRLQNEGVAAHLLPEIPA